MSRSGNIAKDTSFLYGAQLLNLNVGLKVILLFLVALVSGSGFVLLLYQYPLKWGAYVCAGATLTALTLAAGSLRKGMLLLLAVTIPLNLDVCLYSRDYQGALNGIFLSLPDLCVVVLTALLVLELLSNRSRAMAFFPRTTLPLASLVLAAVLSIVVTVNKMHTLYGVIAFAKVFALYFVLANSINSEREARFVFNSLLMGLILAASVYLAQSILHVDLTATGEVQELAGSEALGGNVRPGGILGQANNAGGYFAGLLMVALASLGMRHSILQRITALCAVSLGLWALLMTFTRGGWVAFACGFLFLMAVGLRKRVFGGVFPAVLLCLVPLGVVLCGDLVITRMTTNLETRDVRKPLVRQAYYIIGRHPILGIGANAYNDVLYKEVPASIGGTWLFEVHNGFLSHWAEMGTVGLLVFVWLLFSLGREAWPLLGAEDRTIRSIGLGSLSYLLSQVVFMFDDQWRVFSNSGGLSFCVLLAIAASLSSRKDASAARLGERVGPVVSAIRHQHLSISQTVNLESR